MKKSLVKVLTLCLVVMFVMSATGCFGSSDSGSSNYYNNLGNNAGTATSTAPENNEVTDFGDVSLSINSCEMTTDDAGKDIVIVTYGFTNNDYDEGMTFWASINDTVSQNGVKLEESDALKGEFDIFNPDEAKSVAKGETIEVKVAYELLDTTSDVLVEATKTISIADEEIVASQRFTVDQ